MTGNWSKGNYSQFYFVIWVMKAKLISYSFVKKNSRSKFSRVDSSKSKFLSFMADIPIFIY